MRWWGSMVLVVALAVAALWLANCSGPQPEVTAVRVEEPAAPGQPYQVVTQVANRGPGYGEVQVTVRLRERATGAAFQQQEKVTLAEDETVRVVTSIDAPPGQYDAEVEAQYPPR